MIILLSPAKSLDMNPSDFENHTLPRFGKQTNELIRLLKKESSSSIQKLMKVSQKIADLNVDRYKSFQKEFTRSNAKQAVLAFTGDVYRGLENNTLSPKDLNYANDHVRILSGLYGLLRPLDLMQAYRLEMGTSLKSKKGKNLYQFWGTQITDLINADIEETNSKSVLNLASNEYAKAVHFDKLNVPHFSANFKEYRGEDLKFISFNAKKARGTLTRYIVDHEIRDMDSVKSFDRDGYRFSEEHSTETEFIFVR